MPKLKAHYFIRAAYFLTAIGYAYMHLFYRRYNLWKVYDSSFVKFATRKLDIPIEQIFNRGAATAAYLNFLNITGIILLVSGLLALVNKQWIEKMKPLVIGLHGAAFLVIFLHAFSGLIDSKLHYNVPLEYFTRLGLPLLMISLVSNHYSNKTKQIANFYLPLIIGITFFAHGIYALRIFPIPSNFPMMTSSILKTPRTVTFTILYIVGTIDILLLVGIFIKRVRMGFVYYAIIWGFLTALARLAAYYNPANLTEYLHLWMPQFLIRSGHYMLPIALLILLIQLKNTPKITTG